MDRGRMNQGILLILLGLYFLLRKLGLVDVTVVGRLWSYWPVLLIVAGIYIIFARSRLWFIPALLSILIFLGIIGVIPVFTGHPGTLSESAFRYDVPASARTVALNIKSPAASLRVQKGEESAVSGGVAWQGRQPQHKQRNEGDHFVVDLISHDRQVTWSPFQWQPPSWEVFLPAAYPIHVTVDTSASNVTLDLRGLDVRDVEVTTTAGAVSVLFDEAVSEADVTITTTAASIELTVPEGIALRIKPTHTVGFHNLRDLGFQEVDGWYVSPEYGSTDRVIEVRATTTVGNLQVIRRQRVLETV